MKPNSRIIKKGLFGKGAAVTAMASVAVLGTAVPSFAASWNGISGTVYSPCSGQTWYLSSNAHTKSGAGDVSLQFSQLPRGGVTWNILGQSNQQYGSTQNWTGSETGITRTLASNLGSGTIFYNHYKEYSGACNSSPYTFQGSEWF